MEIELAEQWLVRPWRHRAVALELQLALHQAVAAEIFEASVMGDLVVKRQQALPLEEGQSTFVLFVGDDAQLSMNPLRRVQ